VLFGVFAGSYATYFVYLKLHVSKSWGLNVDSQFCPHVTILVPARNEERMIQTKLRNLTEVSYPKDKLEVILVDDASTDQTLARAYDFAGKHPELPIKILKQQHRIGKANALNKGLEISSNNIVVVTDADSVWPPDTLRKALPYLSDPTVGAITGWGTSENFGESWVARAEEGYLSLMLLLRLGESKIHSTIRFEGCFCAFKRSAFDEFDSDSGADDSGTALRVVQKGFRAILIPEVFAFSEVSSSLKARTRAKTRRAFHLTGLWLQCLCLLLKDRLLLPKRIAIPEMFLLIFNPIIFVVLTCVTFLLMVWYPVVVIPLILGFCVLSLIPTVRNYVIQGIMDQFILFYSLILHMSKKKIIAWDK